MNFTVEYQLTFEEFKEATLWIVKQSKRRLIHPVIIKILYSVISLCFVFALALLIFVGPPEARTGSAGHGSHQFLKSFCIAFVIILWFVGLIRRRHRLDRALIRAWKSTSYWQEARVIEFSESGMAIVGSTANSRISWAHFVRVDETPRTFLLYNKDNAAEIIPKRIFPGAAELVEFRSVFQRNVNAATRAFPVVGIPISNVENNESKSH